MSAVDLHPKIASVFGRMIGLKPEKHTASEVRAQMTDSRSPRSSRAPTTSRWKTTSPSCRAARSSYASLSEIHA